jgi:hypothetical protein
MSEASAVAAGFGAIQVSLMRPFIQLDTGNNLDLYMARSIAVATMLASQQ